MVEPPPGIDGLAVPDPTFPLVVGILLLVISSFFYAFGPLALAMAATCILAHLILDWLNDLPLPCRRAKTRMKIG